MYKSIKCQIVEASCMRMAKLFIIKHQTLLAINFYHYCKGNIWTWNFLSLFIKPDCLITIRVKLKFFFIMNVILKEKKIAWVYIFLYIMRKKLTQMLFWEKMFWEFFLMNVILRIFFSMNVILRIFFLIMNIIFSTKIYYECYFAEKKNHE